MAKQIYDVVNSVNSQTLGTANITVVNERDLISLGNVVLSSTSTTEEWLNTLIQRIGKTVYSYRQYKSMFSDLVLTDFEYGNIMQKLKVSMPKAEADESYNIVNGSSVDMYKVAKPDVKQKLFTSDTPFQTHISIQRVHLKEAFTSESNMRSFISQIYGEVQNFLELSLENLGRNCLNNYIAEVSDKPTRAINVLRRYNTVTNKNLTVDTAMFDPDFIRYTVGLIKLYSKKMTSMSTLYNDGTTERHTPLDMQKIYLLADYETQFETVVQYRAFNKEFVSLNGYKSVPYWQSAKDGETMNVKVKRASDGQEKTVENIIACIFDKDALGIVKRDEWTSTTPFNSAGGYTNTYWHNRDIYINDMSENFILFYMAQA